MKLIDLDAWIVGSKRELARRMGYAHKSRASVISNWLNGTTKTISPRQVEILRRIASEEL